MKFFPYRITGYAQKNPHLVLLLYNDLLKTEILIVNLRFWPLHEKIKKFGIEFFQKFVLLIIYSETSKITTQMDLKIFLQNFHHLCFSNSPRVQNSTTFLLFRVLKKS